MIGITIVSWRRWFVYGNMHTMLVKASVNSGLDGAK